MAVLWLGLTAFGLFLLITIVGFLFLLVSLVFGELFEHGGELFGGGHDFDHGAPGFFSTRVISVFITAFGGFGAIGVQLGYSTFLSTMLGMASGLVFGLLVFGFARFLYSQQATSTVATTELVGKTAQVTVAIPAGGLGQIRCRIGDSIVEKVAKSRNDEAIPANTAVRVEEILGETAVVSRAS